MTAANQACVPAAPTENNPLKERLPSRETAQVVLIRSYSKIIVLYPTMIAAMICAVLSWLLDADDQTAVSIGKAFFCVLFLNTVMLSFEFPRMAAVTVVAVTTATALAMGWLHHFFGVIGTLREIQDLIRPHASAQFYMCIACTLLFVFCLSWILIRFDYWVVRSNEILHHHGPFGNVERFPAPQLRLDKEIPDMFEYLILRSGRIILYPTGEKRAIVLDNVMRVNRVESRIKRLLEVLEVRVVQDAQ